MTSSSLSQTRKRKRSELPDPSTPHLQARPLLSAPPSPSEVPPAVQLPPKGLASGLSRSLHSAPPSQKSTGGNRGPGSVKAGGLVSEVYERGEEAEQRGPLGEEEIVQRLSSPDPSVLSGLDPSSPRKLGRGDLQLGGIEFSSPDSRVHGVRSWAFGSERRQAFSRSPVSRVHGEGIGALGCEEVQGKSVTVQGGSSPPTLRRVPLTKGNLREWERSVMGSKAEKKAKASVATSTSSQPKTLAHRTQELQSFGIYVDHLPARVEFSGFIHEQTRMVEQERDDIMSEQSEEILRETDQTYKLTNENSWLFEVLPLLVPKARDRRPGEKNGPLTKATFLADGVVAIKDHLFHDAALPSILNREDHAKYGISADATSELKLSKPDCAYGFSRDSLGLSPLSIAALNNHVELYQVFPHAVGVYFVVEAKSIKHSVEKAQLQAARAGATLVAASRQIDRLAGFLRPEGGWDKRSVVFSLAMAPGHAKINVHWIQAQPGIFRYHCHTLKEFLISRKGEGQALQTCILNILDWGVWKVKAQILETLTKLHGRPRYITLVGEYHVEGQQSGDKAEGSKKVKVG